MARGKKNWLINDIIEKKLVELGEKYLSGKMIDIGCGIKPYESLVGPFINEHVGLDHSETQHPQDNIDLYGTAYDIPAEENSFDSALCSFVLEHLEEPSEALSECNRVLKPGGFAIYAVPLIWHLHEEPRDFYRYTEFGLKYLFEKNNFEVQEVVPLSGFIVTFSQLLVYFIYDLSFRFWIFKLIKGPLAFLIQSFAKILSRWDYSYGSTWAYFVVGKKKK